MLILIAGLATVARLAANLLNVTTSHETHTHGLRFEVTVSNDSFVVISIITSVSCFTFCFLFHCFFTTAANRRRKPWLPAVEEDGLEAGARARR